MGVLVRLRQLFWGTVPVPRCWDLQAWRPEEALLSQPRPGGWFNCRWPSPGQGLQSSGQPVSSGWLAAPGPSHPLPSLRSSVETRVERGPAPDHPGLAHCHLLPVIRGPRTDSPRGSWGCHPVQSSPQEVVSRAAGDRRRALTCWVLPAAWEHPAPHMFSGATQVTELRAQRVCVWGAQGARPSCIEAFTLEGRPCSSASAHTWQSGRGGGQVPVTWVERCPGPTSRLPAGEVLVAVAGEGQWGRGSAACSGGRFSWGALASS